MIKYTFTKNNFKKYLKQRRIITNIIFLILGTFMYFCFTYYLILVNPLETLMFYGLYIFILIIVVLLFDELYCFINIRKNNIFGNYEVDIKKDKVIVKIDDDIYEYLNSNIKKIIRKKNYILIKYNSHISLLFMKDIVKYKDYNLLNNINM